MSDIESRYNILSLKSTCPSLKTVETAVEQGVLLVPEKKERRQQ